MNPLYTDDWNVEDEIPTPDDEAHRAMRPLGLTVVGCPCHRCCHLRDITIVGISPIGGYNRPDKDRRVALAQGRMEARISITRAERASVMASS